VRKLLHSAVALASFSTICSAQTITETFGSGANAFSIDFVTIGNPGNAADTTGSPNPAGSVSYTYNLGKYEISRDQVSKVANSGVFISMERNTYLAGSDAIHQPATGISWYEAARFVNHLNEVQGSRAAYKFDISGNFQMWSITDSGYDSGNKYRNSQAKYFLPSSDEWYKGAFGSPDGSWYGYATGSNSIPVAVSSGNGAGSAIYGGQPGTADIYSAGGSNAFGTIAQAGNLWEWTESAFDGDNSSASENRLVRGGSYDGSSYSLSSALLSNRPESENNFIYGFRVASVPEPSSLSLLALGGVVVALRRSKK